MSKKNFTSSFDEILLGGEGNKVKKEENKPGRGRRRRKQDPNITKATFIIRQDQLDKVRVISFMEGQLIKDTLERALSEFITEYERENGEVIVPKKPIKGE